MPFKQTSRNNEITNSYHKYIVLIYSSITKNLNNTDIILETVEGSEPPFIACVSLLPDHYENVNIYFLSFWLHQQVAYQSPLFVTISM